MIASASIQIKNLEIIREMCLFFKEPKLFSIFDASGAAYIEQYECVKAGGIECESLHIKDPGHKAACAIFISAIRSLSLSFYLLNSVHCNISLSPEKYYCMQDPKTKMFGTVSL